MSTDIGETVATSTITNPVEAARLRPAALPPASSRTANRQYVIVRHPGYADANPLLRLPAIDKIESDTQDICGVHYATVHAACAILADNRFDGYITGATSPTSQAGTAHRNKEVAQALQPSGILPAGTYYFHIPGFEDSNEPYPIVPTFQHWRFPHARLPTLWQSLLDRTASEFQKTDNPDNCVMSGYDACLETAHLVPQSPLGRLWFGQNAMVEYCRGMVNAAQSIDDEYNRIRLRVDLHRAWDINIFAFVPKRGCDGKTQLVVHLLQQQQSFEYDWHNRATWLLRDQVCVEFFFSRFAYQVFTACATFLVTGVARAVVKHTLGAEDDISYSTLEDFPDYGKTRSASPKKRKAPEGKNNSGQQAAGDYDHDHESSSCDAPSDSEPDTPESHRELAGISEFEESRRGRKRHRASSREDPAVVAIVS